MNLFKKFTIYQGSRRAVFVQRISIKIYKKYTTQVFKVYFSHVIMVTSKSVQVTVKQSKTSFAFFVFFGGVVGSELYIKVRNRK